MLTGRSLMALGCVITVAVAAGIMLALVAYGSLQYAATVAVIAMNRPDPTPTVALPNVVTSPVGDGYTAATTLAGARTIDDARGPDGRQIIQGMIDSGAAFYLANGTLVQIVEHDGFLIRATVQTGPHRGKYVWLPDTVVNK